MRLGEEASVSLMTEGVLLLPRLCDRLSAQVVNFSSIFDLGLSYWAYWVEAFQVSRTAVVVDV